jgi:hypothetical protein
MTQQLELGIGKPAGRSNLHYFVRCPACLKLKKCDSYIFTNPADCFGQPKRCKKCGRSYMVNSATMCPELGANI